MASLFVVEEEGDVSEPQGGGLLGSSLPATRSSRSSSVAAPRSGLARALSGGGAKGAEPPSLTAPFEVAASASVGPVAASAPGRSGMVAPPQRIRGATVGSALLAVVKAAQARDAAEDKAVGARPLVGAPSTFCLRVAADDDAEEDGGVEGAGGGRSASGGEHAEFGACGAPLRGPWAPDVDFPPLDATALLSSIGITSFVVTKVPSASGDGGLTQLDVVQPAEGAMTDILPSSATADSPMPGDGSSVSSPTSAGPWADSGDQPILRVRLSATSVKAHAGEMREDSRSGRALTLIVERPSADGETLAARFIVSVAPIERSPADTAMTEAPSAEELASSLMSGLFMPKDS
ncbi:hypothetical protein FNF27_07813 [Cafeteria roenbergensis]|uniref:Uncharacterized protein n=1 Tax=Cafeteria roenbergensis TaxID=33653 RepID=A0A5A8DK06_CAFRO|nr:hypothetical protein FNF28_04500 [Cafeteria roenbergensis]KAA0164320.1 hypothetical protein FNF27_07813 [Cafeteria roenbergensis]KAA0166738.1 hypothetical protein FNF31_01113 [Cafeteria roenbergensis]